MKKLVYAMASVLQVFGLQVILNVVMKHQRPHRTALALADAVFRQKILGNRLARLYFPGGDPWLSPEPKTKM